jgi:hypothetical protein
VAGIHSPFGSVHISSERASRLQRSTDRREDQALSLRPRSALAAVYQICSTWTLKKEQILFLMESSPESLLNLTGWNPEQKSRLEALTTEADFRETNTPREHVSPAVKHFRRVGNGEQFTPEQIGRVWDARKPATIKRQNGLSHELQI